MSNVYFSNRMENLRNKLADKLRESKAPLFTKNLIVTQTTGMDNWLTRELTSSNGIFANYRFMNQEAVFRLVYETLFGEPLRSNVDKIKYAVFDLLKTDEFQCHFPDVAEYHEDDDMRCIQLAARIADLFDQYQVYRNEMLEAWQSEQMGTTRQPKGQQGNEETDSGKENKGSDAEAWQRWLWNKLVKDYGIQSKHTIRKQMYDALDGAAGKLKEVLPEVHLFGISIYTRFHLDFFKVLGKHVDVYHYVMLPNDSDEYKNELLRAWGTKAIELNTLFAGIKTAEKDFQGAQEKSLLDELQNCILENRDLDDASKNGNDESITINSCHTVVREIECLYDYLLNLFDSCDNKPGLDPGGILVIVPDINKYAPYIRAVFKNAPVNLPIEISGYKKNIERSITHALESLVNVSIEDITAEQVVGLIEQYRFRKRYKIDNPRWLRAMVGKVNIRFGMENRPDDDTYLLSWKNGLDKIILGYAMHSKSTFDEKYPFEEAEGSGVYDLIRLKAFVEDLEAFLNAQQGKRSMTAWKKLFVEMVLDGMVYVDDFDEKERKEQKEIYQALGFIDSLDYDTGVSFEVFLHELKQRLFNDVLSYTFHPGRINFSPPIPVRGLPYDVIAFTGLDNGRFPRQDQFMSVDLLGESYLIGDRSPQENDKSLFLDTILAARKSLYLSYIGQSVKNNDKLPPSVLLDTLMDYAGINQIQKPLHGFSDQYDDKEMFTYLYNDRDKPQLTSAVKPRDAGEQNLEAIDINRVIEFFKAPVDYYCKRILGVNFDDEEETLVDTEIFQLNNLEIWHLKNEIIHSGINQYSERDLNEFIRQKISKGSLPLKFMGQVSMKELLNETRPIAEEYRKQTGNHKEHKQPVDIKFNGLNLTGILDGMFDKHLITLTLSGSSYKHKYRMSNYLKSLILSAMPGLAEAVKEIDNDGSVIDYKVKDADEATKDLEKLCEFFIKGRKQPLKFTIAAALAYKANGSIEKNNKNVLKAIQDEAKPYEQSNRPPNKYLRLLFDEGYFNSFTEKDLDEIKELGSLLNLINE